MDHNQPAVGESQQNTSPPVDPVEHARLQEVVVRQGAIISLYQDQLEALRVAAMALQPTTPASTPPTASTSSPHGELACMALPEKFDGSVDRCHGFLRQCEIFFAYQPEVYHEEGIAAKCAIPPLAANWEGSRLGIGGMGQ